MLKPFKNIITQSDFTKNTFTLMAGTIIAQIVPFAMAPVLTRLYTPEEFGLFSLYVSIVNVMAIISTCRYEFAIMLPKGKNNAFKLFILSFNLILLATIIGYIFIFFFNSYLIKLFNIQSSDWWLYLVPLTFMLVASYSVLSYWLNRNKDYRELSISLIVLKVSTEIGKLVFGILKVVKNGLMLGFAFGHVVVNIIVGIQTYYKEKSKLFNFKQKDIKAYAIQYKQFPLFNMPYSLIGTFSSAFIIFAFTYFKHVESAGYFGLTRSLLFVPVTLMSGSLGRVFFKEASDNFGDNNLEKLFRNLINIIVEFSIPGIIFFIFWAPFLFEIFFGHSWRTAGVFASIYTPVIFMYFLTNWPIRIFEVRQKQYISLVIQVVIDCSNIIIILLLLNLNIKPVFVVLAYSVTSIIYHIVLLNFIVKVSLFNTFRIFKLLLKILNISIPLSLFLILLLAVSSDKIIQICLHAGVIVFYYLCIFYKYYKNSAVQ